MEITRLSTKGQVVLPKAVRSAHAWGPGMEFTVEETVDGVLLRPAGRFPESQMEQIAGSLRSKRKPKTLVQMRDAIAHQVSRRHDGGRY